MNPIAIAAAARLLAEARQSGTRLDALPENARPSTNAEAHAVQDALIDLVGEPVAGWKVAGITPESVMRGAILGGRLLPSPATIPAGMMPLRGIEAEVAFRFDSDFPDRDEPYAYEEVVAAVVPLAVIELVDSRFASYADTPPQHRLCDFMSNGGLVYAEPLAEWRDIDLVSIPVVLRSDAATLADSKGGHANGDPLLPAVALVNALRNGRHIRAGQIVTTGSYTGLKFAAAGERIEAAFEGLGRVEVTFEA